MTLGEAFERLREYHRRAPFRYFNGNTFADLGRQLAAVLFSDLPPQRLRAVTTAVAHYIAGTFDQASMEATVEQSAAAALAVGDRVRALHPPIFGEVVEIRPDGRIVWRPEQGGAPLVSLPDGLVLVSTGGAD